MKYAIVAVLLSGLLTACQGPVTNEDVNPDILQRAYTINYRLPSAAAYGLPTLLEAFDTMAFGNRARVTRWKSGQTLRLRTVGRMTEKERNLIQQITDDLSSRIPLKFQMVDSAADLEIIFSVEARIRFQCVAGRRIFHPTSNFTTATITVYSGSPTAVGTTIGAHCLSHEFLHAIGFPGHAQWFNSNSNYRNEPKYFTPWDYLFMRTLYDPRLKPGTPRNVALANACDLMSKELVSYQKASARTRPGSPDEYCGQLAVANAEIKNAQAQFEAGLDYANGWYVEKDHKKAFALYLKAANQGHAPAQTQTGQAYSKGLGVRKDDTKAFQWFQKAADNKDVAAAAYIGFAYANGTGVEKSQELASRWYRIALDRGGAQMAIGLGLAFEKGTGVRQDRSEALKWYRLAAQRGAPRGYAMLAKAYFAGIGLSRNWEHGRILANSAALAGDPLGQFFLAVSHQGDGDFVNAYRWAFLASRYARNSPVIAAKSSEILRQAAGIMDASKKLEAKRLVAQTEAEIKTNGEQFSAEAKAIVAAM